MDSISVLVRALPFEAAHDTFCDVARRPDAGRAAVAAAAALGDPDLVDWLIDRAKDPALTRVAGGAIMTITGIDFWRAGLTVPPPDEYRARTPEELHASRFAPDSDEDLPWLDLSAVEAWWERERHRFPVGRPHLLGYEVTEPWLWEVLRDGRQRQRATAAVELSLLRPGHPLFEVRAPAFRQASMLGA